MKLLDTERLKAVEVEDVSSRILIVRLNRLEVSNAINTQMGRELLAVFGALDADPSAYRCVVLTGAGTRAFCGGADLKERDGMSDEDFGRQHYLFERMNRAITFCPVPLICAANGSAVAGGLELLLACDFAYAATDAMFGFTETLRGIMPGGGGTQQLPRAIGVRRAKEVILRGRYFTAGEALEWGVVNKLCTTETLLDEAVSAAEEICRSAPLSVTQVKKAIDLGMQCDLRTGLYAEIEAYRRLIPTEDRLEGIRAFNEKREPRFRGR